MRKTILILLTLFSLNVWSQHLSMFGIPLDGSIENFASKLSSKGITVDKELSKQLPNGVRAFKGSFAGYYASRIFLFYDPHTRTVFKGTVGFYDLANQTMLDMFEDIKGRIIAKYNSPLLDVDDKSDSGSSPQCKIYIYNRETDALYGYIQMGITVTSNNPYSSYLYITYQDVINMELYEKRKSDDL